MRSCPRTGSAWGIWCAGRARRSRWRDGSCRRCHRRRTPRRRIWHGRRRGAAITRRGVFRRRCGWPRTRHRRRFGAAIFTARRKRLGIISGSSRIGFAGIAAGVSTSWPPATARTLLRRRRWWGCWWRLGEGVVCVPHLRMRGIIASLVLLALTACSATDATAAAMPDPDARDQLILVPVTGADGNVAEMQTRLCRPAGGTPAGLVVINHGSPPDAAVRPRMRPGSCGQEAAQWFLGRGYAVAMPLRRGYGATGGDYAESIGPCLSVDFVHA